jgi:hypothetical protein
MARVNRPDAEPWEVTVLPLGPGGESLRRMGGSKARAWFVRRDFERGVLTGGPQKTSPSMTLVRACFRKVLGASRSRNRRPEQLGPSIPRSGLRERSPEGPFAGFLKVEPLDYARPS